MGEDAEVLEPIVKKVRLLYGLIVIPEPWLLLIIMATGWRL